MNRRPFAAAKGQTLFKHGLKVGTHQEMDIMTGRGQLAAVIRTHGTGTHDGDTRVVRRRGMHSYERFITQYPGGDTVWTERFIGQ
jgi:hypothetical protein